MLLRRKAQYGGIVQSNGRMGRKYPRGRGDNKSVLELLVNVPCSSVSLRWLTANLPTIEPSTHHA